jgi:uncharacterized protein YjbJ (UPF0337 family)
MKRNNREDRLRGSAKEIKGHVKEKTGRALGNRRMEGEGTMERLGGKARRKIGEVEKVFED